MQKTKQMVGTSCPKNKTYLDLCTLKGKFCMPKKIKRKKNQKFKKKGGPSSKTLTHHFPNTLINPKEQKTFQFYPYIFRLKDETIQR